jgi:hypothetical protein
LILERWFEKREKLFGDSFVEYVLNFVVWFEDAVVGFGESSN